MPRLTVLQLDTNFPRIQGDVACLQSYHGDVEIKRIPKASVQAVVGNRPDQMDISAFEEALAGIDSGIVTTSCGFLGYWQDHLAGLTPRPFLASSLCRLEKITKAYDSTEVAIVTFDQDALTQPLYQGLLQGFDGKIIGLEDHHHLKQVIKADLDVLDAKRAEDELLSHLDGKLDGIRALILECTNLPPYKSVIRDAFDVDIHDIMTCLDEMDNGLVRKEFAA